MTPTTWNDVVNAAWPPGISSWPYGKPELLPYERMVDEIANLVASMAYGTADPHELFVARLRERTMPMFIVHHDEGVSDEVVEFMSDYAARMRARPTLMEGTFSVAIDVGLHPDDYRERLRFYDQPCMYAEGD